MIFNICICSEYSSFIQTIYHPLNVSSEFNMDLTLNKPNFIFGSRWWASDNLQLSGNICPKFDNKFNVYNNFGLGYYSKSIKWLYATSSFFEVSFHKVKYNSNFSRLINYSYKSRYEYNNLILGYDINHYLWKNIRGSFISLILTYYFTDKFLIELKTNVENNLLYLNSFNLSILL